MKPGNLNFLEPSGPLQACNGTDLPFTWGHNIRMELKQVLCIAAGLSWLTIGSDGGLVCTL